MAFAFQIVYIHRVDVFHIGSDGLEPLQIFRLDIVYVSVSHLD